MKKNISIILTMSLLLCLTVFNASAGSLSEKNTLNNYEISIIKAQGKIFKKSTAEIAESILSKAGMGEKNIAMLTEEQLADIADCTQITKTTEYCKYSEADEKEYKLTKKEFNDGLAAVKQEEESYIKSGGNEIHYSSTDNYFIKNLYIYKTLNAPSGTYGIMASFEWKNFTLTFRGTDVISLSGENLVFEKNSFGLAVNLRAVEVISNSITSTTNIKEFPEFKDYKDNNVWHSQNAIAYKYKLPKNLPGTNYSLTYTSADFLIMCRARVSNPTIMTTFNVFAEYHHQKITFLGSLSITANGMGVSVSPKIFFKNFQITTDDAIVYYP